VADDKTYTQAEVDALVAEQTSGLKSNRDEALKEAKKAKEALKSYDGVDPRGTQAAQGRSRRSGTQEGRG
jgi:hypothetical protein